METKVLTVGQLIADLQELALEGFQDLPVYLTTFDQMGLPCIAGIASVALEHDAVELIPEEVLMPTHKPDDDDFDVESIFEPGYTE